MGEHLADIPPDILTKQLIVSFALNIVTQHSLTGSQCFFVTIPVYQFSLCSAKASITFQYLRVFSNTPIRIPCYIILGVLAAFVLSVNISSIVTCIPVSKFWNSTQPGHCVDKEALWFSAAAIHILSDFVLLFLPMPVLNSLHLPKRQKYALMLIFAFGSL